MKIAKNIVILFILIVFIVAMQACLTLGPSVIYTKNDINLYSAAIHSVAGVFSSDLDEVLVLDEDKYGRKLFFTNFSRSSLVGDFAGVFIVQKTDDKYVYYYEDINYIIKPGYIDGASNEMVYERFSLKTIESLKEKNDWGNEGTSHSCFSVPINGDKFYLTNTIPEEQLRSIGEKFFSEMLGDTPMCEDSFGNIIWFMKGHGKEDVSKELYYVLYLKSDGTLKSNEAIMEINDIWDYRDQMIAFKEANGWNKP